MQQSSVITTLPSSSSSSCSSSSSNASSFPLSFSPDQKIQHQAEGQQDENQWPSLQENGESSMEVLRFIGITDHGGGAVKWKDIEKRFNRLALIRNGHEQVVKWSDFCFCIGKKICQFEYFFSGKTKKFPMEGNAYFNNVY